jgi:hypothetical protein
MLPGRSGGGRKGTDRYDEEAARRQKKVEERRCEQGRDLAVAVGDGGREGGLTLSSLEGCGARRVERGRGRGNMLHVAIGGVWSRL